MLRSCAGKRLFVLGLVSFVCLATSWIAPYILVMNNAAVSDYIVVLDGHDQNYLVGLRLLQQGFGRKMLVCPDLPDVVIQGGERKLDLAFVQSSAQQLAERIELCTNENEEDLSVVIRNHVNPSSRILLVSPERSSRAQLIRLRKQMPEYQWTVRSVPDDSFNMCWWKHRRWTKSFASEMIDLIAAFCSHPQTSPSRASSK